MRFLTRERFATLCGQIQRKLRPGPPARVALVGFVTIYVNIVVVIAAILISIIVIVIVIIFYIYF